MVHTADNPDHIRLASYFYLSYAHSPPLSGQPAVAADQRVRTFFADLTRAVALRSVRPRGDIGFFDQATSLSLGWTAARQLALSTAETFVPLLSAGYFSSSWPGREWACFRRRLLNLGIAQPEQRFVPVLWTPIPGGADRPGYQEALVLGANEPAYADIGLRNIQHMTPYRDAYLPLVEKIAERIIAIADAAPLRPSAAPDIAATPNPFPPSGTTPLFTIAVAAPAAADLPPERSRAQYGLAGADWRAYPGHELPLAEYAAQLAEQLDFTIEITGIGPPPAHRIRPGLLLVDPWLAADDGGCAALRDFAAGWPAWMLPLIVLDPPGDAQVALLADKVRSMLPAQPASLSQVTERAARGVASMEEFVSLVPALITEAARRHLRYGPARRPPSPGASVPRLTTRSSNA